MEVRDAESLESALDELLRSPELRQSMVHSAAACLEIHRSATDRTVQIIQGFLQATPRF